MMRLLIAVLYTQYSLKQQNGKYMTPCFQTCFYLALVGTILIVGALKGLIDYTHHTISQNPNVLMECVLLMGSIMATLFFGIKQVYFNTDKYIEYCKWFEEKDAKTQAYLANMVNIGLAAIPIILLGLSGVGYHRFHRQLYWR
jgi:hypothetical protein